MEILIESQYFPPISTFSVLNQYDSVCFDVHSYYEKKSYRNRCEIIGANGVIRLSIPISKRKGSKIPMSDVKMDFTEDWKREHWQSIISSYGRSAYFTYYEEELKELFFQQTDLLVDWNESLFRWICEQLQFSVQISRTTAFIPFENSPHDYRNKICPNQPTTEWGTKSYEQVFADRLPFIPNLSILDLLFSQGPNSIEYL